MNEFSVDEDEEGGDWEYGEDCEGGDGHWNDETDPTHFGYDDEY